MSLRLIVITLLFNLSLNCSYVQSAGDIVLVNPATPVPLPCPTESGPRGETLGYIYAAQLGAEYLKVYSQPATMGDRSITGLFILRDEQSNITDRTEIHRVTAQAERLLLNDNSCTILWYSSVDSTAPLEGLTKSPDNDSLDEVMGQFRSYVPTSWISSHAIESLIDMRAFLAVTYSDNEVELLFPLAFNR
jgi:hypothetical protein